MTEEGDANRLSRKPIALEVIALLQWRVAKTMPEIPHEYTSRRPESAELYFQLFELIQTEGDIGRYKGRKKRYLLPGDGRKYWAMTTHKWSSYVINRMLIEDDLPRVRRERWLEGRQKRRRRAKVPPPK